MARGQPHLGLAQLALADVILEHRVRADDAAADRDEHVVLAEDGCLHVGDAFDARRPLQLDAVGRAEHGLDARLLALRGALEGDGARKFHVRVRFIQFRGEGARQRGRDAEREQAPRDIAAEARDEFEFERELALARQPQAHAAALADEARVVIDGEALHRHIVAEERERVVGRGAGDLEGDVELRDLLADAAGVGRGGDGHLGIRHAGAGRRAR